MKRKTFAALLIGFGFFEGIAGSAGILLEPDFPVWLFLLMYFLGGFSVVKGCQIYIKGRKE